MANNNWNNKDPAAVVDYVYRIPLDAGDSVASIASVTFFSLSGTVVIQSKSLAASPNTTSEGYGQDLTVWLSGGVDGETDVFKVTWTTAQTRTNDDIVTLNVANVQLPALSLTTWANPLPGHLSQRYPAFANVAFSTIQYWLTDAQRFVTTSWRASDYPFGIMALAAHNMAIRGLVSDGAAAQVPGGVNRFKMGPMEFELTKEAANAKLGGDLTSTVYGLEYQTLLNANLGGPRIADSGYPIDGVWPFVPA